VRGALHGAESLKFKITIATVARALFKAVYCINLFVVALAFVLIFKVVII
jgi:hypothetical protein